MTPTINIPAPCCPMGGLCRQADISLYITEIMSKVFEEHLSVPSSPSGFSNFSEAAHGTAIVSVENQQLTASLADQLFQAGFAHQYCCSSRNFSLDKLPRLRNRSTEVDQLSKK